MTNLCGNCGRAPVASKGRCHTCYEYRRNHGGTDRPLRMAAMQEMIGIWGDRTFPRDSQREAIDGILHHLEDEVEELREAIDWHLDFPADATLVTRARAELADVFILAFQVAHQLGVDAEEIVRAKMAVNRSRRWGAPDHRGVVRHVD